MEEEREQSIFYGMGEKLKKEVIMNYCNPEGFKKEIKGNIKKGKNFFFSWFDGGKTVAGAFKKSEGIFKRLMLPWAKKFDTSLDIGYGGGGQVLAASKYFKYALGVDVHEEVEFVEKELKKRNKEKNIALFIGDGKTLPVDNEKVDFVSSWVTFLHLGTIEVVESYLKEIYRVLRGGGVAVIFFTRLVRTKSVQTEEEYSEDIIKEKQHITGYREGGPKTLVNRANLVISLWKMASLAKTHGFAVLSTTRSHDKDKIYGQHGIVIQKPKTVRLKKTKKKTRTKIKKKGEK